MPKKKCITVCPICGSEKFTIYKGNKFLQAMASDEEYVCKRCKNVFPIPIEVCAEDAKAAKKLVKEADLTENIVTDTQSKMVVNYGIFIVALLALGLTLPGLRISPFAGLLLLVFGVLGLAVFIFRKIKG